MLEETTGSSSKPSPERVLPNVSVCRVKPIGTISEFANCLVERPMECPYVLYFGEGNICRNPMWREFARAQSSASKQETE